MSLEKEYPKIVAKLENREFVEDVRDLIVVDENYDDIDSDEFDVFDPSDYNFMIYITERLQKVLTEEGMTKLITLLDGVEGFETFFAHEIDMYGVMAPGGNEEGIARMILNRIEKELV